VCAGTKRATRSSAETKADDWNSLRSAPTVGSSNVSPPPPSTTSRPCQATPKRYQRYREELGDTAVERAETLAAELVDRKRCTGALETVADALYLHGVLTGDDLEAILASP